MNRRMEKVLLERLSYPFITDEIVKSREIIEKMSGMELARALSVLRACSETLSQCAIFPGVEVKHETTAALEPETHTDSTSLTPTAGGAGMEANRPKQSPCGGGVAGNPTP